jgi:hypothetical protein
MIFLTIMFQPNFLLYMDCLEDMVWLKTKFAYSYKKAWHDLHKLYKEIQEEGRSQSLIFRVCYPTSMVSM